MRRPVLATVITALLGCSAARVQRAPVTIAPRAVDRGAVVPPSDVHLAPELAAEPWIAATDADGARYVVRGSLRARVTDRSVLWADERFARPVLVAAPVADGWVFVAADGAVARSATFLEPLESLGEIALGGASVDGGGSRGRIALVDGDGRLFVGNGRRPFTLAEGLPEGVPVLAACFADATHGAAVLDGGLLFATDDGGVHWVLVPMHADAAWNAFADTDARIVVQTTGGDATLHPDGTLEPRSRGSARTDRAPLDDAARRSLLLAALQHDPGALRSIAPRADGTVALADRDDVLRVDARTGRATQVFAGALPEARCRLQPWGTALAARCPGGLYRSGDGGESFAPVGRGTNAAPTAVPLDLVLSDDGEHAVGRGPVCGAPSLGSLCVLDPGGNTWRRLDATTPSGLYGQLFELHGERLLAGLSLVDPRIGVVDVASGAAQPLSIADETAVRGLVVQRASWQGDNVVAVGATDASDDAPRFVAIGRPDATLDARPMPARTLAVAFADAQRGVAFGRDLDAVFRTVDGGVSWTRVPVPVVGALPLSPAPGAIPSARCDDGGCVVGERLVVRGWGPFASVTTRARAAEQTRARDPAVHFAEPVATALACHIEGPVVASVPFPDGAAPRIGARRVVLAAGGIVARVDAWRDPRSAATTLQAQWRIEGETGFVGRTHAMHLALDTADADLGDAATSRYTLRGATRRGLLLDRCPHGHTDRSCQLLFARAGGDFVPVTVRDALDDAVHGVAVIPGTLPLPDGGLVLRLRVATQTAAIDLVAEIAPDGHVRRRRAFAWHPTRAAALRTLDALHGETDLTVADVPVAGSGARPGLATRRFPIASDAAAMQRFVGGSLRAAPCRTAREPETVVLEVRGRPDAIRAALVALPDSMSVTTPVREVFELSQGSSCLRTVRAASGEPGGDAATSMGNGLELSADGHGTLSGSMDDGHSRARVHCGP